MGFDYELTNKRKLYLLLYQKLPILEIVEKIYHLKHELEINDILHDKIKLYNYNIHHNWFHKNITILNAIQCKIIRTPHLMRYIQPDETIISEGMVILDLRFIRRTDNIYPMGWRSYFLSCKDKMSLQHKIKTMNKYSNIINKDIKYQWSRFQIHTNHNFLERTVKPFLKSIINEYDSDPEFNYFGYYRKMDEIFL